ncbi:Uu.00g126190.m01.CDS01 [Anthostomella pinea]|uniref:Uu.00g126190.m01.CDS01 n=1 Tax=Anthostomella pinea TaxID=933095 RepID=A0AAI8VHX2_9PEZI|nr:Uu.00g126190.m01.CDS01 [Anthostomella pinea]
MANNQFHQPYEMHPFEARSQEDQSSAIPYQQYAGQSQPAFDQYGVPANHFDQSRTQIQPALTYPQQYVYASDPSHDAVYPVDQQWYQPGSQDGSRGIITDQQQSHSSADSSMPSPYPQEKHDERQGKKSSWWPYGKTVEEKVRANMASQFDGKRGFNGHLYNRPNRSHDTEQGHVVLDRPDNYGGAVNKDEDGKFIYLNSFGQKEKKFSDVATYLSPTNYRPKRLVVQAADYVLEKKLAGGDWRRRKMNGDVPKVLKISEWALRPFQKTGVWHKINGSARLLAASIPLQLLMAFPGTSSWENEDVNDTYTDHPGYSWQWAKHAINPLDQRPDSTRRAVSQDLPSSRKRLVRPRKLYVRQPDEQWKVVDNPPRNLRYVFISYAAKSFRLDGGKGQDQIRSMAKAATLDAGCTACWVDTDCIDVVDGAQKDVDIYGMCDVIRASRRVVVILPDDRVETRKFWGSRMWTLPEALLAPGTEIHFFARVDDGYTTNRLSLIEMTGEIWDDPADSEAAGGATRLLAEHFSNELTLSRLELFTKAVDACVDRSRFNYKIWTPNDVTLAVMGLLHYRIERDDQDSAFQSLAQLSLGNDSDRIIERMVSLYPVNNGRGDGDDSAFNPFYTLAKPDQFSTHLWDVQPTCYAVGVAHEDNTILLDSCRVMHIRWKGFPRIVVARDYGLGRLLATVFVTAGTWWFLQGITLAVYYAPFLAELTVSDSTLTFIAWLVAGVFFVAALLSVFGPLSVRRLYGGQVLQSTSNLVGFEGVVPLAELERLVFGNVNGRLNYEPSSTPICASWRDANLRVGREPDWVTAKRPEDCGPLPEGHRLFTLVDTGTLGVSIFSAERPPTVALLCGREGGMLRAVLCSWQFENDCLYKEAVVRMPSSVRDAANLKGWLKVCLATMDQQRGIERAKRMAEVRAEQEKLMGIGQKPGMRVGVSEGQKSQATTMGY